MPANLLAEGRFFVLAAVCTYNPDVIHAIEPNAVSFQSIDQIDSRRDREKYAGRWPGVMRPALRWEIAQIDEAIAFLHPKGSEVTEPDFKLTASPNG